MPNYAIAAIVLIALFVLATLVVGVRHWVVGRSVLVQVERLRPIYGRYAALEIEVLGQPPVPSAPVAGAPGPPADQPGLLGSTPASGGSKPIGRENVLRGAAAIDGAFPGVAYAWNWHHLDEHLFQAIHQMTGHAVASVADMKSAMADWSKEALSGPSAALVNSVKGHLGEWLAQDHLASAGHHVAMAEHANQAAWDLKLEGLKVNVKTVQDARIALHDHIMQSPTVALLLPHDAAHLPADALHFDPMHGVDLTALHHAGGVMVDDALSHADAAHSAQQGLEVATGHVHLHIPWITLYVATVSEGRLWLRGDTDLGRAAKNVAVTTTAVGIGGAVGAKAGAAVGTFILPGIGTIVGTLAGGILGAFTGRDVSVEIKRQPLEDAKKSFDQEMENSQGVERAAIQEAEQAWSSFYQEQEASLAAERDSAASDAKRAIAHARDALGRAQTLSPAKATLLLTRVRADLVSRVQDARLEFERFTWWRRALWPSAASVLAGRIWVSLRRDFARWDSDCRRLQTAMYRGEDRTSEVFDLVLVGRGGEAFCRELLARVGVDRARTFALAEKIMGEAVGRVVQARSRVATLLRAKQEGIKAQLKTQLDPALTALATARERLISEMKKAGLPVPREHQAERAGSTCA